MLLMSNSSALSSIVGVKFTCSSSPYPFSRPQDILSTSVSYSEVFLRYPCKDHFQCQYHDIKTLKCKRKWLLPSLSRVGSGRESCWESWENSLCSNYLFVKVISPPSRALMEIGSAHYSFCVAESSDSHSSAGEDKGGLESVEGRKLRVLLSV